MKRGRPTSDPCKQYTILLPESVSKGIKPKGGESRSKRVSDLVKLGIKQEKRVLKK